jgi:predicted ATP-grasp superfamily ATP-dependent carboligase
MTPNSRHNRPVVILNMHYTGLAIARGLQDCGAAPIYGLGANETMFGNFSRYCKYVSCPDTEVAAEQCRDFLTKFSDQFDTRPLLFPTRDHDLQFLSKYYGELEERYVVVAAPPQILQTILNKASLYRVAHELGIPYPATAWINSHADIERVKDELLFPVIVKPVYTTQWRRKEVWEIVRQKAVIIQDYDELRRFYARIELVDPVIHIQEFIPGADANLVVFGSYVNPKSKVMRYFTGRKLLQYPARSGTGVAVQACPVPGIVEPSRKLLARLGYCGVSEIEYKYDRRNGNYVLIEMNPRFWDQHGLGAATGVNLAECLFLDLTKGHVPEQHQNPEPLTWIAEDGYLVSFLSNLKTRCYPVGDFFRALKGQTTLAVFERGDWHPAGSLAARLIRDIAKDVCHRVAATVSRRVRGLGSALSSRNKRN